MHPTHLPLPHPTPDSSPVVFILRDAQSTGAQGVINESGVGWGRRRWVGPLVPLTYEHYLSMCRVFGVSVCV